jgi:hypothetical protein
MNAVWKKLCPRFIHRLKGFEEESYEDVANKTVKSAEQLELNLAATAVEELDALGARVTNK